MSKFYFSEEAKSLLADFENSFEDAWFVAYDIKKYIDAEYDGDKETFLKDVASCCDYCSSANALRSIFDFCEF